MKPIGVGITLVAIVGIIGFLFMNGVIESNKDDLEKSIQNISQNIQETTKTAKDIATETSDTIQKTITDTINTPTNLQEPLDSAQKQVIDNAKHILSNMKKSPNHVQEVIKDTVNYTQPKIKDSIESVQNKVTDTTESLIQIDNKKYHAEIIQYALKKINEDREKNNLKPVLLSSNVAAQAHSDDVFAQKAISHWMSNGEKPYMTYTNSGGTGAVSQNVAVSTCSGFGCSMEPIKQIESSEYSMMHDDASSNWGHRDNILQPYHTHVSIGISYDDNFFTMVQNFEDNYLVSENPISITGSHVQINSNLKSGNLLNIGIFYDPLPTPELYLRHYNDRYYMIGDYVAIVEPPASPNSYYDQPSGYKLIEARKWSTNGNSVFIDFDASSILTNPGVYTVGVWVNENGKDFLVTNYSIFYK